MFKQLFSTMNDLLDQIAQDYQAADYKLKQELQRQLSVLKSMSADCIEQWLMFEEKMAQFAEASIIPDPFPEMMDGSESIDISGENVASGYSESFEKGQGYFKLLMFDEAIREFEAVVRQYPNFVTAKLYLALGYLHKGDYTEAYRQFRFIIPMTNQATILAIVYNAMGCIQASKGNVEGAVELFSKSHLMDPALKAPLVNMEVCRKNKGHLHDGAGTLH